MQNLFTFLHQVYLLEIVGGVAVTCLGWVCCYLTRSPWLRSAPLWLGGYLLVYNLDRLHYDPADQVNTPTRFLYRESLRSKRLLLIWLSAATLAGWPAITGRWWLIPPILLAIAALQFYSRPAPLVRKRLKDLPALKTFIAPFLIAAVLVLWPVLEIRRTLGAREMLVFFWCFIVLSVNSISFDLRDIQGDLRNGTRTLPVLIGANWSTVLVGALALLAVLMSPLLGLRGAANILVPCSLLLGAGSILAALFSHVQPITLSFVADLFFCLPAVALWVAR
ncbi:MAG TPA: UbiA family prenyltransferase [Chthoniobacterales bacterium]|nr:UbiA family prenyltransferase [Chthoniobacterales bacterium]